MFYKNSICVRNINHSLISVYRYHRTDQCYGSGSSNSKFRVNDPVSESYRWTKKGLEKKRTSTVIGFS